MTDRTLQANEIAEAIRRPTYEMQEAALAAGYASVRDWALVQCVEEVRALKARVDALEQDVAPHEGVLDA